MALIPNVGSLFLDYICSLFYTIIQVWRSLLSMLLLRVCPPKPCSCKGFDLHRTFSQPSILRTHMFLAAIHFQDPGHELVSLLTWAMQRSISYLFQSPITGDRWQPSGHAFADQCDVRLSFLVGSRGRRCSYNDWGKSI